MKELYIEMIPLVSEVRYYFGFRGVLKSFEVHRGRLFNLLSFISTSIKHTVTLLLSEGFTSMVIL
jgi:hypothetical protein